MWVNCDNAKQLSIKPTKHEEFHRLCALNDAGDLCSVALSRTDFLELKVIISALFPLMHGLHYISEPTYNHPSKNMVSFDIYRKNDGRKFGVSFNPPYINPHGCFLHGAYFFRFYHDSGFLGVALPLSDIAAICTFHDGKRLLFSSLHGEDTIMVIESDRDAGYYFTAYQNDIRICYKLQPTEFYHLRRLLKDSIPMISGFDYVFSNS